MSANDYLFLTREGDKYILSHRDADTDAEMKRWEFDELEGALAKAEEEQGRVEYGIVLGFGVKLKVEALRKLGFSEDEPMETKK